ncbi:MAG: hypothetical protein COA52_00700 [Hyphomicrobiales bacterium]|nr:MAG: hypothetical protein COA52_00700 [Hyphomicrobiales bacterium]
MIIYRVQNSAGAGPYTSGWHPPSTKSNVFINDVHPDPYDDDLLFAFLENKNIYDFKFAFYSLKQASEWINGWSNVSIHELSDVKFKFYSLEIDSDDVIAGEKQCIYHKNSTIEIINSVPLMEIYNEN